MAGPVVVHTLRVFGVTYQTADVQLAFDFPFVTDNADDRNKLARPFAFVEDVKPVGLHPHDFLTVYFAGADRLAEHGFQVGVLRRTVERSLIVWVQV